MSVKVVYEAACISGGFGSGGELGLVLLVGLNAEGYREVLGCDVITTEDGAGWTAFLRDLVARGLSGVRLVVSDDHQDLKQAVAAVLSGASRQRCRTHFARNLLSRVPPSHKSHMSCR